MLWSIHKNPTPIGEYSHKPYTSVIEYSHKPCTNVIEYSHKPYTNVIEYSHYIEKKMKIASLTYYLEILIKNDQRETSL